MRCVLKNGGKLVCSVPNPIWGHIMLYPGLFEYRHFRKFPGTERFFEILRVRAVGVGAARDDSSTFGSGNPNLQRAGMLQERCAGLWRELWRAAGHFPAFCYWLWTFEAAKVEAGTRLHIGATKPADSAAGLIHDDIGALSGGQPLQHAGALCGGVPAARGSASMRRSEACTEWRSLTSGCECVQSGRH